MTAQTMLVAGRIGRPWGLGGDVRIRPALDDLSLLEGADGVTCELPGQAPQPIRIRRVKWRGDVATVVIEGVRTREQAVELRGGVVRCPASLLPEPDEGEFYPHQIVGLTATDASGAVLGTVTEVTDTGPGGSALIVVRADAPNSQAAPAAPNAQAAPAVEGKDIAARELLVPATPEFIVEVDLESGTLVLTPPEDAAENAPVKT